jgi:hypothetical protein
MAINGWACATAVENRAFFSTFCDQYCQGQ